MKGQMEIFIIVAFVISALFFVRGVITGDISSNLLGGVFAGILILALMTGA
ncbi:MAG: hypothetical protein HY051_00110 [Candidatus Aenigmarchaeota archaeon]|nr:hypothetical protein [Candidatus Aenigmarchaeota archaeon]